MYVHFHNEYPLCFQSKEQYTTWSELARGSTQAQFGPCTDCTPEFQDRMKKEMRCEHPEVEFDKDEDGFISGYIPYKKKFLAAFSNIASCRNRSEF